MDRNQPAPGGRPPLIEFRNVTVVKEGKKLLDAISLTVAEGENIAILGPNGAGKSSLIRAITREYYPAAGMNATFRVLGRETWDVFALRSMLGVVSNDLQYTYTREVTGMDVILSGFFSSIGLFNREITPGMIGKSEEIARFLEVSHLLDRPMTTLSSGEARRLLIGRALVHDPGTLVLDEPANSLDLHAHASFRRIVQKIASAGTGIILVTHNLPDIIPGITRVVLMKNGRIVRDGRKEDLLTDREIGSLFAVPVHIREDDGWYYATGY